MPIIALIVSHVALFAVKIRLGCARKYPDADFQIKFQHD